MRSYLSYFVSQNPKTIKSLSVFKDDNTSSYKAFDEEGNVETIAESNKISSTTLNLTDNLTGAADFTGTITLPNFVNMGSVFINRGSFTIDNSSLSAQMFKITVNSNLITANSVIFTSVETADSTDTPIVYINSKSDGVATIFARNIWGTNTNTQDSFRINFMIINPS
jgi:hypothetical protein